MHLTTESQILEAKIDRIKERNKQFNNNSWRLQNLAFNDQYNNWGDSQQKKTEDLNNTINPLDLIDINRTVPQHK